MSDLIVRKSLKAAIRTGILLFIGGIIRKFYCAFKYCDDVRSGYEFTGARKTAAEIIKWERVYFDKHIYNYKREQDISDIEKTAEYYNYKKIEGIKGALKICNVGCFYCLSDYLFLSKNKDAVVYGLDFGNIYEINKDLKSDRLKLFSGYPLSILEEFVKKGEQFDYVLFSRVANLININELMSYMEVLTKIAKNICMLEVVKLFGNATTKVDINKIRVTKSMKAYSGVYIHNYPVLLRKFGYVVMEAKILSPYSFEQYFSDDHYFIYIHGRKGDIEN